MNLFGSDETVDQKAQAAVDDLGPDPTRYEVGAEVGEIAARLNVDPDDVEQKLREHDDEDVLPPADEMRPDAESDPDALVTDVAAELGVSLEEAQALLDAVADSDGDVGDIVTALGDVDQRADTDTEPETTMGDNGDPPDDTSTDQKQENDGMDALEVVEQIGGEDQRETIEEYAESVGNDPQECAAKWVEQNVDGMTLDAGDDGGEPDAAGGGDYSADQAGTQPTAGQPADQKSGAGVTQAELNSMVADAVTSDEVLDELAGAVTQKMATDDELTDDLVNTVEQKGDFATTDQVTTGVASQSDSKTVDDAAPLTGGDGE